MIPQTTIVRTIFDLKTFMENSNLKLNGIIENCINHTLTIYFTGDIKKLDEVLYNYMPVGIKCINIKFRFYHWFYLKWIQKINKDPRIRVGIF